MHEFISAYVYLNTNLLSGSMGKLPNTQLVQVEPEQQAHLSFARVYPLPHLNISEETFQRLSKDQALPSLQTSSQLL